MIVKMQFRYHCEIFAMVAKFSCSHDLHFASFCLQFLQFGFKISLKLQKLIQEKLHKSEKQARTQINLKIRQNLRREIKEIEIKYDKMK